MLRYLRWVQYCNDDPLIDSFRELGCPVRELKVYKGHTIVGFPTVPIITTLDGIEDHIVTAGQANMRDQFEWLRLGEAFWLEGHDVQSYLAGIKTLPAYGNQISYTLKYDPDATDYDTFRARIEDQQPTVRCCSVMPQDTLGASAYEYLPSNRTLAEKAQKILPKWGNSEGAHYADKAKKHRPEI